MANMSYCRFRNTQSDLADCEDYFHEEDLSADEHRARARMVDMMRTILEDLGCEVSDPEEAAPWIYEDKE